MHWICGEGTEEAVAGGGVAVTTMTIGVGVSATAVGRARGGGVGVDNVCVTPQATVARASMETATRIFLIDFLTLNNPSQSAIGYAFLSFS